METMPKIQTIQTPRRVFRKPHNPVISEAFKKALTFSGSVRGPVYRKVERAIHTINQKEKFRRK